MSEVYDIADRYVRAFAALDPISATDAGIAGHDHELTDYSPAGAAARAELDARHACRRSRRAAADSDDDRIAADVMTERLQLDGRPVRRGRGAARRCGSSAARCRTIRVLRPHGVRHRRRLGDRRAPRIARVPGRARELRGRAARRASRAASSRRAAPSARVRGAGRRPGAAERPAVLPHSSPIADPANLALGRTRPRPRPSAYAQLGAVPPRRVRAEADPRDPVGAERYALFARAFNGIELDLDETYAWGWEELYRIEDAMREVGERILPGARARCGHRPPRPRHAPHDRRRRRVPAVEPGAHRPDDRRAQRHALRHRRAAAPMRGDDRAAGRRGGDVLHRPERGLLPARPHVVPDAWARTHFPLWREVSTCYHEAVPGHHLQVAQVRYLADRSRVTSARSGSCRVTAKAGRCTPSG